MAIAFMPSEEETEARYERLNRLLMELYDVLCHIMAARTVRSEGNIVNNSVCASNTTTTAANSQNRARPSSDSSAPRPRLPDLLLPAAASGPPAPSPRRRTRSVRTPPTSPSCTRFCFSWTTADDDVFLPPPTPPLHRHRRRRRRSTSLKDSKRRTIKYNSKVDDAIEAIDWTPDDENSTSFEDSIESVDKNNDDSLTSSTEEREKVAEPENSIISSFLSTSLGGSLWTAVVLVVGWKLFSIKR